MKRTVIKLTLLVIPLFASAQVNLHYFEKNIPQSNYLNPSHISDCKLTVGFPLLNALQVQFAHSGFTYNQFIQVENGNTVSPLDNAIQHIGRNNYLAQNLDISSLFISLKRDNMHFSFAVRDRENFDLYYNKGLLILAIEGNSSMLGKKASLKSSQLALNYFRQYSFGFATIKNRHLTYGFHFNLLFGKANFKLTPKKFDLLTDEETFNLEMEMDMTSKGSMPFILLGNEGSVGLTSRDNSVSEILMNRGNKGISTDIGITYQYDANTTIYASILDLGFIRYKTNVFNYHANGDFNYDGNGQEESLSSSYVSAVYSNISNSINYSSNTSPYTYFLPIRLYLGAAKNITGRFKTATLLNTTIQGFRTRSYASLQASYLLSNHINTMASWSWYSRSLMNIGAGLSFDFYPINFYFLTDNIGAAFWPYSSKNVNLQFGINFKFGCRERSTETGSKSCSWITEPKEYQIIMNKNKGNKYRR